MTDNTELKRLAEGATPGPWSVCGEVDSTQGFEIVQDIWNEHGTHTGMDVVVYEWSYESDPLGVIRRPDADFIAAANPSAVLALIAENERLFKLLERTVDQHVPLTELEGVPGWSRAVELVEVVAERDQLRAEIAGLRTGYEAYERVNAELNAETEALRKSLAGLLDVQGIAGRAAMGKGS
ncbi:hypothetical protein GTQ41_05675 [Pseudomonas sp. AN-B15]|uniref:ead/Ea22-like family protein n=1 Tax=Pseudomonas sp. AN-B15 TaxID=2697023 RepID=UPI001C2B8E84|nr:ead/Ea22-like family protein [Pseudomonas sp. AN-B15]QXE08558.1 hypothetical protein GTQ41_05675 [Pseudomonas sp. AN-B15]